MNKKALVIAIVSVAATVAVVGASVGLTMKLQARPDSDYRERIAANKDVEINGEKMYYLAPDSSEYQDENYYREAIYKDDKGLNLMELPKTTTERVLGMIELRNLTQALLKCQMEDGSDAEVALLQQKLNKQYDQFTARYGLISSTANKRAFYQDSS